MASYSSQGAFQSKEQLREQQKQAARKLAGAYSAKADLVNQAVQQSESGLRAAAANALAAGLSQGGVSPGSGAMLASGRQAAMQAGQQLGVMRLQNAGQVGQAQTDSAQAGLEQLEYEKELGNVTDERNAKKAAYEGQINKIIEANKHWNGDDPEKARADVLRMVDRETDPELKNWLVQQAERAYQEVD